MRRGSACALVVALMCLGTAQASLTTFASFSGDVGVSSDGFGSIDQSGTIHAWVPAGSTVQAAYLYTGMFGFSFAPGGTLGGTPVAYGPTVVNTSSGFLAMARADVTSIVAPVVNAGGGVATTDAATGQPVLQYSFDVTETSSGQDGEALVVVYHNPAITNASVGILDGFSALGGDSTSINFATPLDPTQAGFFAEMRIGDNFSCCSQASQITVNGTIITTTAGNNDDGLQVADGSLITVGGNNDPFSPFLPSYADDHERYNLISEITKGDTSINVNTVNPSHDDNIFLAIFDVNGNAGFNQPPPNQVPEPATIVLLGTGLLGVALRFRRKNA